MPIAEQVPLPRTQFHLVTETSSPVAFTRDEIPDITIRRQIKAAALYDYMSHMMAHYLPWDADFFKKADDLIFLFDLPEEHPFIKILEYSDLIRINGQIEIRYPRLGLDRVGGVDTLWNALGQPYENKKKHEPRETTRVHSDDFHHDKPAIAVFGSASSADASCPQIGTAIGEKGHICIVGGDGKEEGNAMRLIAENAHDAGATYVGMITTGYLFHAQGARKLASETQIYVAATMDERIQLFWERSDVFLGIKGGLGVIM